MHIVRSYRIVCSLKFQLKYDSSIMHSYSIYSYSDYSNPRFSMRWAEDKITGIKKSPRH